MIDLPAAADMGRRGRARTVDSWGPVQGARLDRGDRDHRHQHLLHPAHHARPAFALERGLHLAVGELRADRDRGALLLVGLWWVLSARKWFTGPIRNVDEAVPTQRVGADG
jgi:hypothetical protein